MLLNEAQVRLFLFWNNTQEFQVNMPYSVCANHKGPTSNQQCLAHPAVQTKNNSECDSIDSPYYLQDTFTSYALLFVALTTSPYKQ